MTNPGETPRFSIVIPFYNEGEVIERFLAEVQSAASHLPGAVEAILVDDGSTDDTRTKLEHAARGFASGEVVSLQRNRGQAAALWEGFQRARGTWVITFDGDGQNDPADLPKLLACTDRYDMVVGIRANRRDTWLRRAMSRIANRVRGPFLRDRLQDSGCALKIFRREIVGAMYPIRSLYSFIPAFAVAAGFKVGEVVVNHRKREAGVSKYGFGTFAWRPLVDMLALWWLFRRRL
jgi:dolichol-phosphate mannosyltransferase